MLKHGDSNTLFYFKMVAARKYCNQIHFLIGNDGRMIENITEIENHCVNFFQELLGKESTPLSVADCDLISSLSTFNCTTEMKKMLIVEVSATEIKETIFALPVHKAPGPDEYNTEFLKATWSVIGSEITRDV